MYELMSMSAGHLLINVAQHLTSGQRDSPNNYTERLGSEAMAALRELDVGVLQLIADIPLGN